MSKKPKKRRRVWPAVQPEPLMSEDLDGRNSCAHSHPSTAADPCPKCDAEEAEEARIAAEKSPPPGDTPPCSHRAPDDPAPCAECDYNESWREYEDERLQDAFDDWVDPAKIEHERDAYHEDFLQWVFAAGWKAHRNFVEEHERDEEMARDLAGQMQQERTKDGILGTFGEMTLRGDETTQVPEEQEKL